MIWSKRAEPGFPPHVEGLLGAEKYVYTPGAAGKRMAEGLIRGVFVAEKCRDGTTWFPPRGFCPDLTEPEYVEIPGDTPWTVLSYTIVYRDYKGDPLPEPVTMVFAVLEGTLGGLIHRLKPGAEPFMGMRVKAVFRAEEERRGTIKDILYFEPA